MTHSESITKLAAALIAFRSECPVIPKEDTNPHFKSKYAGLPTILDKITPVLVKHGLIVVQSPDGPDMTTMVIHSSGEWIKSSTPLNPTKNDPQGVGSAITYMRRYMLASMLLLNVDNDDDGNAASQSKAPAKAQSQPAKPPVHPNVAAINNELRDQAKLRDYKSWCEGRGMKPQEFVTEAAERGCKTLDQLYHYAETGEVK